MARTDPYNPDMYPAYSELHYFRIKGQSVKSSPSYAGQLYLPARLEQYFVVNQQLDAPLAQEKTRFEEIHRST
jgi:hypothetical protein